MSLNRTVSRSSLIALPPPVILVKTHSAMSKLVSKEVSMATFFKLPLKED